MLIEKENAVSYRSVHELLLFLSTTIYLMLLLGIVTLNTSIPSVYNMLYSCKTLQGSNFLISLSHSIWI